MKRYRFSFLILSILICFIAVGCGSSHADTETDDSEEYVNGSSSEETDESDAGDTDPVDTEDQTFVCWYCEEEHDTSEEREFTTSEGDTVIVCESCYETLEEETGWPVDVYSNELGFYVGTPYGFEITYQGINGDYYEAKFEYYEDNECITFESGDYIANSDGLTDADRADSNLTALLINSSISEVFEEYDSMVSSYRMEVLGGKIWLIGYAYIADDGSYDWIDVMTIQDGIYYCFTYFPDSETGCKDNAYAVFQMADEAVFPEFGESD